MYSVKFFPSGSLEVLVFINVSFLFRNNPPPLKKGVAVHLKKLKSPSFKNACAKVGWN